MARTTDLERKKRARLRALKRAGLSPDWLASWERGWHAPDRDTYSREKRRTER